MEGNEMDKRVRFIITGFAAGTITGILGSGGGMVLVPLLSLFCKEEENHVFPSSLAIMLPICCSSLLLQVGLTSLPFSGVIPYLAGGAVGGILSCIAAERISAAWLHRLFGILLLWSGFRCLFC